MFIFKSTQSVETTMAAKAAAATAALAVARDVTRLEPLVCFVFLYLFFY